MLFLFYFLPICAENELLSLVTKLRGMVSGIAILIFALLGT